MLIFYISIDTTAVIDLVKKLFHGHPELVEGFNNFLPPPLKIDVLGDDTREEPTRSDQKPPEDTSDPEKAEFYYARSYVKKIKQRFHSQPHIYKSFLDILHTFNREQQSLSSVYEGVARLFKDHTDLLQEFKHFLPETSLGISPDMMNVSQVSQKSRPVRAKSISVDKKQLHVQESPPSYSPNIYPRYVNSVEASYGTYRELSYFYKIKEVLPVNEYEEFMKVLFMYNMEIISKSELYYLGRDLLRYTDPELTTWFRSFIQADDIKDDDDPSGYLADFDWSRSEKLGPSYRSIPEKWKQWKCSGRVGNAICLEVLNDSWLSVPTGSEDGTFKNSRKNQYEELLFKLEDDRYELDLMIESNLSTIKFLEDIKVQMDTMTHEERRAFKINESEVSVIHINAIKKIYGHKGEEMVKMLFNNTSNLVDIVLNRLKQKDIEWNISRNEWNELWKEIAQRNHYKAFDHQSIHFKQEERKTLIPKTLLSELRKKSAEKKVQDSTSDESNDSVLENPLLTFDLSKQSILEDIKLLLSLTFESVIQKGNSEKFLSLFNDFLAFFLELPKAAESTTIKPDPSTSSDSNDRECKPIVTIVQSSDTKHKNLFFGNDSFYLMFRYLCIVYNRLLEAWKFSEQSEPVKYRPQYEIEAEQALESDQDGQVKSENKEDTDYQQKRYQQFLYNIELLLSNTIDQSAFEDKCRMMFGNYAYSLFTIDRLLVLLAKQMQVIQGEETTEKLLGLYKYELSKPNGFSESVYLVNYHEVLSGEKKAFVFTFDLNSKEMGIRDVDLSSATLSAELTDDLSRYVNNLAHETKNLSEYEPMKPPLFLKRNIQKNISFDEQNVDISYGLACKVTSDTYKLRFVENTEDFFRRLKKVQSK